MGKIIITTLLAILLLAPQAGLQAEGDQKFPNGKPFSDLNTRIDVLEKRILALEDSDPPSSSEVTFAGDFIQGELPGETLRADWAEFRRNATGKFTSIEIKNNLGGSLVCSDSGMTEQIASALNRHIFGQSPEGFTCGSLEWNVGDCLGGVELSANSSGDVCSCETGAAVRPEANSANLWGGIGLTCNAKSQRLEVILTR